MTARPRTLSIAAAVAVIFIVLALAMFDLFVIDFSRFGASVRMPESAHFGGIFLMGALSAVLAGACVAPVLAAALVQAAKMVAHGDYYGLALPFALGFGMALPWPVAAAGIGLFPKPGRWMMRVKQLLGVFILGLAAYYGWTAWTLFADGRTEAAGMASGIGDSAGIPDGFSLPFQFRKTVGPSLRCAMSGGRIDKDRVIVFYQRSRFPCRVVR